MKKFYPFLVVPYLVGSAVFAMEGGRDDPPLPLQRSHRVGGPLDNPLPSSQESAGGIPLSQYGPAYDAWQAHHPVPAEEVVEEENDGLVNAPTLPYVPPLQSPPGGSQGTA